MHHILAQKHTKINTQHARSLGNKDTNKHHKTVPLEATKLDPDGGGVVDFWHSRQTDATAPRLCLATKCTKLNKEEKLIE